MARHNRAFRQQTRLSLRRYRCFWRWPPTRKPTQARRGPQRPSPPHPRGSRPSPPPQKGRRVQGPRPRLPILTSHGVAGSPALRGLGQRMLGAVKKQGRKTRTDSVVSRTDSVVMLACESLRRAGRQHPKRIVCGRRGTERKEEPRGLQITDSRETAEQPFLDRAFAAELTAHESCTPQRCTQHQQPLLVSGQGPSACADRVRAPTGWRRARSLGSSCTCCIPYAGLALVQANARIAPQRVFQGPVQFPGAFRCRHDVRVVHKGNSSPGLSDRRISPRGPPLANGARCPCHDRSMVGAGSAASRAGRSPTAELLPSSGLARSFDLRRACSAVLPARMGALLPLLGVVMRWSHPIVGVCWAHWVAQRSSPPAWTAAAEEILRCVAAGSRSWRCSPMRPGSRQPSSFFFKPEVSSR